MDGWDIVIARSIPLVVWIAVRWSLPDILTLDGADPEQGLRRRLVTDLVLGATIVIFAGGLVQVGIVTPDVARLLYTAYGTVAAIIGFVLLWRLRERKR